MKHNYVLGGSASCFDLYNLEKQLEEIHANPIDFIHYDVVDGLFNQCIILGLPLLTTIRKHTKLPIEVHLATFNPDRYIKQFIDAGADIVSIHPEGTKHLMKDITLIESCGAKPALALRSETDADESMLEALAKSEYVIKLTVNPGFSGQKIQPSAFQRMKALRDLMDTNGIDTPIAADGNVNIETIPVLAKHGATMLIGGTSGLFLKDKPLSETAKEMRDVLLVNVP